MNALKDIPVLPGGCGRASYWVGARAPRLVRGEGCLASDQQGRVLIDANNNFATLVLGHADPAVVEALTTTATSGTCYGLPNEVEERLGLEIISRITNAEQVRFTNSGTEAVLTALRLARATTGRSKVLGVAGSYHGSSDVALAVGGARLSGVPESVREEVLTVQLNDVDGLRRVMESHGRDIAAVLLDLLPNYAGLVQVDPDFVTEARELCDAHGALLVMDEVISFRLALGGLQADYPVSPDLTVLGKAIGGGLPIGAVVGAEPTMRLLNPLLAESIESSGTFTGNPMSTAAGLACLQQYGEAQIGRLNMLGEALLAQVKDDLPDGWCVRGAGSLVRVFAPDSDGTREAGRAFWWALYERGVIAMPSGLMALSTPMTQATIDMISRAVLDAATQVAADVGPSA